MLTITQGAVLLKLLPNEHALCLISSRYLQRWIQWGCRERGPPFFSKHLFFCDHIEEQNTVLIKVKLIINNAPLTYVYPNTIKTYLTPNHLMLGRQLLCYSNTKSTVVRNLTDLLITTDKRNRISNHFGIGGDMNMQ